MVRNTLFHRVERRLASYKQKHRKQSHDNRQRKSAPQLLIIPSYLHKPTYLDSTSKAAKALFKYLRLCSKP